MIIANHRHLHYDWQQGKFGLGLRAFVAFSANSQPSSSSSHVFGTGSVTRPVSDEDEATITQNNNTGLPSHQNVPKTTFALEPPPSTTPTTTPALPVLLQLFPTPSIAPLHLSFITPTPSPSGLLAFHTDLQITTPHSITFTPTAIPVHFASGFPFDFDPFWSWMLHFSRPLATPALCLQQSTTITRPPWLLRLLNSQPQPYSLLRTPNYNPHYPYTNPFHPQTPSTHRPPINAADPNTNSTPTTLPPLIAPGCPAFSIEFEPFTDLANLLITPIQQQYQCDHDDHRFALPIRIVLEFKPDEWSYSGALGAVLENQNGHPPTRQNRPNPFHNPHQPNLHQSTPSFLPLYTHLSVYTTSPLPTGTRCTISTLFNYPDLLQQHAKHPQQFRTLLNFLSPVATTHHFAAPNPFPTHLPSDAPPDMVLTTHRPNEDLLVGLYQFPQHTQHAKNRQNSSNSTSTSSPRPQQAPNRAPSPQCANYFTISTISPNPRIPFISHGYFPTDLIESPAKYAHLQSLTSLSYTSSSPYVSPASNSPVQYPYSPAHNLRTNLPTTTSSSSNNDHYPPFPPTPSASKSFDAKFTPPGHVMGIQVYLNDDATGLSLVISQRSNLTLVSPLPFQLLSHPTSNNNRDGQSGGPRASLFDLFAIQYEYETRDENFAQTDKDGGALGGLNPIANPASLSPTCARMVGDSKIDLFLAPNMLKVDMFRYSNGNGNGNGHHDSNGHSDRPDKDGTSWDADAGSGSNPSQATDPPSHDTTTIISLSSLLPLLPTNPQLSQVYLYDRSTVQPCTYLYPSGQFMIQSFRSTLNTASIFFPSHSLTLSYLPNRSVSKQMLAKFQVENDPRKRLYVETKYADSLSQTAPLKARQEALQKQYRVLFREQVLLQNSMMRRLNTNNHSNNDGATTTTTTGSTPHLHSDPPTVNPDSNTDSSNSTSTLSQLVKVAKELDEVDAVLMEHMSHIESIADDIIDPPILRNVNATTATLSVINPLECGQSNHCTLMLQYYPISAFNATTSPYAPNTNPQLVISAELGVPLLATGLRFCLPGHLEFLKYPYVYNPSSTSTSSYQGDRDSFYDDIYTRLTGADAEKDSTSENNPPLINGLLPPRVVVTQDNNVVITLSDATQPIKCLFMVMLDKIRLQTRTQASLPTQISPSTSHPYLMQSFSKSAFPSLIDTTINTAPRHPLDPVPSTSLSSSPQPTFSSSTLSSTDPPSMHLFFNFIRLLSIHIPAQPALNVDHAISIQQAPHQALVRVPRATATRGTISIYDFVFEGLLDHTDEILIYMPALLDPSVHCGTGFIRSKDLRWKPRESKEAGQHRETVNDGDEDVDNEPKADVYRDRSGLHNTTTMTKSPSTNNPQLRHTTVSNAQQPDNGVHNHDLDTNDAGLPHDFIDLDLESPPVDAGASTSRPLPPHINTNPDRPNDHGGDTTDDTNTNDRDQGGDEYVMPFQHLPPNSTLPRNRFFSSHPTLTSAQEEFMLDTLNQLNDKHKAWTSPKDDPHAGDDERVENNQARNTDQSDAHSLPNNSSVNPFTPLQSVAPSPTPPTPHPPVAQKAKTTPFNLCHDQSYNTVGFWLYHRASHTARVFIFPRHIPKLPNSVALSLSRLPSSPFLDRDSLQSFVDANDVFLTPDHHQHEWDGEDIASNATDSTANPFSFDHFSDRPYFDNLQTVNLRSPLFHPLNPSRIRRGDNSSPRPSTFASFFNEDNAPTLLHRRVFCPIIILHQQRPDHKLQMQRHFAALAARYGHVTDETTSAKNTTTLHYSNSNAQNGQSRPAGSRNHNHNCPDGQSCPAQNPMMNGTTPREDLSYMDDPYSSTQYPDPVGWLLNADGSPSSPPAFSEANPIPNIPSALNFSSVFLQQYQSGLESGRFDPLDPDDWFHPLLAPRINPFSNPHVPCFAKFSPIRPVSPTSTIPTSILPSITGAATAALHSIFTPTSTSSPNPANPFTNYRLNNVNRDIWSIYQPSARERQHNDELRIVLKNTLFSFKSLVSSSPTTRLRVMVPVDELDDDVVETLGYNSTMRGLSTSTGGSPDPTSTLSSQDLPTAPLAVTDDDNVDNRPPRLDIPANALPGAYPDTCGPSLSEGFNNTNGTILPKPPPPREVPLDFIVTNRPIMYHNQVNAITITLAPQPIPITGRQLKIEIPSAVRGFSTTKACFDIPLAVFNAPQTVMNYDSLTNIYTDPLFAPQSLSHFTDSPSSASQHSSAEPDNPTTMLAHHSPFLASAHSFFDFPSNSYFIHFYGPHQPHKSVMCVLYYTTSQPGWAVPYDSWSTWLHNTKLQYRIIHQVDIVAAKKDGRSRGTFTATPDLDDGSKQDKGSSGNNSRPSLPPTLTNQPGQTFSRLDVGSNPGLDNTNAKTGTTPQLEERTQSVVTIGVIIPPQPHTPPDSSCGAFFEQRGFTRPPTTLLSLFPNLADTFIYLSPIGLDVKYSNNPNLEGLLAELELYRQNRPHYSHFSSIPRHTQRQPFVGDDLDVSGLTHATPSSTSTERSSQYRAQTHSRSAGQTPQTDEHLASSRFPGPFDTSQAMKTMQLQKPPTSPQSDVDDPNPTSPYATPALPPVYINPNTPLLTATINIDWTGFAPGLSPSIHDTSRPFSHPSHPRPAQNSIHIQPAKPRLAGADPDADADTSPVQPFTRLTSPPHISQQLFDVTFTLSAELHLPMMRCQSGGHTSPSGPTGSTWDQPEGNLINNIVLDSVQVREDRTTFQRVTGDGREWTNLPGDDGSQDAHAFDHVHRFGSKPNYSKDAAEHLDEFVASFRNPQSPNPAFSRNSNPFRPKPPSFSRQDTISPSSDPITAPSSKLAHFSIVYLRAQLPMQCKLYFQFMSSPTSIFYRTTVSPTILNPTIIPANKPHKIQMYSPHPLLQLVDLDVTTEAPDFIPRHNTTANNTNLNLSNHTNDHAHKNDTRPSRLTIPPPPPGYLTKLLSPTNSNVFYTIRELYPLPIGTAIDIRLQYLPHNVTVYHDLTSLPPPVPVLSTIWESSRNASNNSTNQLAPPPFSSQTQFAPTITTSIDSSIPPAPQFYYTMHSYYDLSASTAISLQQRFFLLKTAIPPLRTVKLVDLNDPTKDAAELTSLHTLDRDGFQLRLHHDSDHKSMPIDNAIKTSRNSPSSTYTAPNHLIPPRYPSISTHPHLTVSFQAQGVTKSTCRDGQISINGPNIMFPQPQAYLPCVYATPPKVQLSLTKLHSLRQVHGSVDGFPSLLDDLAALSSDRDAHASESSTTTPIPASVADYDRDEWPVPFFWQLTGVISDRNKTLSPNAFSPDAPHNVDNTTPSITPADHTRRFTPLANDPDVGEQEDQFNATNNDDHHAQNPPTTLPTSPSHSFSPFQYYYPNQPRRQPNYSQPRHNQPYGQPYIQPYGPDRHPQSRPQPQPPPNYQPPRPYQPQPQPLPPRSTTSPVNPNTPHQPTHPPNSPPLRTDDQVKNNNTKTTTEPDPNEANPDLAYANQSLLLEFSVLGDFPKSTAFNVELGHRYKLISSLQCWDTFQYLRLMQQKQHLYRDQQQRHQEVLNQRQQHQRRQQNQPHPKPSQATSRDHTQPRYNTEFALDGSPESTGVQNNQTRANLRNNINTNNDPAQTVDYAQQAQYAAFDLAWSESSHLHESDPDSSIISLNQPSLAAFNSPVSALVQPIPSLHISVKSNVRGCTQYGTGRDFRFLDVSDKERNAVKTHTKHVKGSVDPRLHNHDIPALGEDAPNISYINSPNNPFNFHTLTELLSPATHCNYQRLEPTLDQVHSAFAQSDPSWAIDPSHHTYSSYARNLDQLDKQSVCHRTSFVVTLQESVKAGFVCRAALKFVNQQNFDPQYGPKSDVFSLLPLNNVTKPLKQTRVEHGRVLNSFGQYLAPKPTSVTLGSPTILIPLNDYTTLNLVPLGFVRCRLDPPTSEVSPFFTTILHKPSPSDPSHSTTLQNALKSNETNNTTPTPPPAPAPSLFLNYPAVNWYYCDSLRFISHTYCPAQGFDDRQLRDANGVPTCDKVMATPIDLSTSMCIAYVATLNRYVLCSQLRDILFGAPQQRDHQALQRLQNQQNLLPSQSRASAPIPPQQLHPTRPHSPYFDYGLLVGPSPPSQLDLAELTDDDLDALMPASPNKDQNSPPRNVTFYLAESSTIPLSLQPTHSTTTSPIPIPEQLYYHYMSYFPHLVRWCTACETKVACTCLGQPCDCDNPCVSSYNSYKARHNSSNHQDTFAKDQRDQANHPNDTPNTNTDQNDSSTNPTSPFLFEVNPFHCAVFAVNFKCVTKPTPLIYTTSNATSTALSATFTPNPFSRLLRPSAFTPPPPLSPLPTASSLLPLDVHIHLGPCTNVCNLPSAQARCNIDLECARTRCVDIPINHPLCEQRCIDLKCLSWACHNYQIHPTDAHQTESVSPDIVLIPADPSRLIPPISSNLRTLSAHAPNLATAMQLRSPHPLTISPINPFYPPLKSQAFISLAHDRYAPFDSTAFNITQPNVNVNFGNTTHMTSSASTHFVNHLTRVDSYRIDIGVHPLSHPQTPLSPHRLYSSPPYDDCTKCNHGCAFNLDRRTNRTVSCMVKLQYYAVPPSTRKPGQGKNSKHLWLDDNGDEVDYDYSSVDEAFQPPLDKWGFNTDTNSHDISSEYDSELNFYRDEHGFPVLPDYGSSGTDESDRFIPSAPFFKDNRRRGDRNRRSASGNRGQTGPNGSGDWNENSDNGAGNSTFTIPGDPIRYTLVEIGHSPPNSNRTTTSPLPNDARSTTSSSSTYNSNSPRGLPYAAYKMRQVKLVKLVDNALCELASRTPSYIPHSVPPILNKLFPGDPFSRGKARPDSNNPVGSEHFQSGINQTQSPRDPTQNGNKQQLTPYLPLLSPQPLPFCYAYTRCPCHSPHTSAFSHPDSPLHSSCSYHCTKDLKTDGWFSKCSADHFELGLNAAELVHGYNHFINRGGYLWNSTQLGVMTNPTQSQQPDHPNPPKYTPRFAGGTVDEGRQHHHHMKTMSHQPNTSPNPDHSGRFFTAHPNNTPSSPPLPTDIPKFQPHYREDPYLEQFYPQFQQQQQQQVPFEEADQSPTPQSPFLNQAIAIANSIARLYPVRIQNPPPHSLAHLFPHHYSFPSAPQFTTVYSVPDPSQVDASLLTQSQQPKEQQQQQQQQQTRRSIPIDPTHPDPLPFFSGTHLPIDGRSVRCGSVVEGLFIFSPNPLMDCIIGYVLPLPIPLNRPDRIATLNYLYQLTVPVWANQTVASDNAQAEPSLALTTHTSLSSTTQFPGPNNVVHVTLNDDGAKEANSDRAPQNDAKVDSDPNAHYLSPSTPLPPVFRPSSSTLLSPLHRHLYHTLYLRPPSIRPSSTGSTTFTQFDCYADIYRPAPPGPLLSNELYHVGDHVVCRWNIIGDIPRSFVVELYYSPLANDVDGNLRPYDQHDSANDNNDDKGDNNNSQSGAKTIKTSAPNEETDSSGYVDDNDRDLKPGIDFAHTITPAQNSSSSLKSSPLHDMISGFSPTSPANQTASQLSSPPVTSARFSPVTNPHFARFPQSANLVYEHTVLDDHETILDADPSSSRRGLNAAHYRKYIQHPTSPQPAPPPRPSRSQNSTTTTTTTTKSNAARNLFLAPTLSPTSTRPMYTLVAYASPRDSSLSFIIPPVHSGQYAITVRLHRAPSPILTLGPVHIVGHCDLPDPLLYNIFSNTTHYYPRSSYQYRVLQQFNMTNLKNPCYFDITQCGFGPNADLAPHFDNSTTFPQRLVGSTVTLNSFREALHKCPFNCPPLQQQQQQQPAAAHNGTRHPRLHPIMPIPRRPRTFSTLQLITQARPLCLHPETGRCNPTSTICDCKPTYFGIRCEQTICTACSAVAALRAKNVQRELTAMALESFLTLAQKTTSPRSNPGRTPLQHQLWFKDVEPRSPWHTTSSSIYDSNLHKHMHGETDQYGPRDPSMSTDHSWIAQSFPTRFDLSHPSAASPSINNTALKMISVTADQALLLTLAAIPACFTDYDGNPTCHCSDPTTRRNCQSHSSCPKAVDSCSNGGFLSYNSTSTTGSCSQICSCPLGFFENSIKHILEPQSHLGCTDCHLQCVHRIPYFLRGQFSLFEQFSITSDTNRRKIPNRTCTSCVCREGFSSETDCICPAVSANFYFNSTWHLPTSLGRISLAPEHRLNISRLISRLAFTVATESRINPHHFSLSSLSFINTSQFRITLELTDFCGAPPAPEIALLFPNDRSIGLSTLVKRFNAFQQRFVLSRTLARHTTMNMEYFFSMGKLRSDLIVPHMHTNLAPIFNQARFNSYLPRQPTWFNEAQVSPLMNSRQKTFLEHDGPLGSAPPEEGQFSRNRATLRGSYTSTSQFTSFSRSSAGAQQQDLQPQQQRQQRPDFDSPFSSSHIDRAFSTLSSEHLDDLVQNETNVEDATSSETGQNPPNQSKQSQASNRTSPTQPRFTMDRSHRPNTPQQPPHSSRSSFLTPPHLNATGTDANSTSAAFRLLTDDAFFNAHMAHFASPISPKGDRTDSSNPDSNPDTNYAHHRQLTHRFHSRLLEIIDQHPEQFVLVNPPTAASSNHPDNESIRAQTTDDIPAYSHTEDHHHHSHHLNNNHFRFQSAHKRPQQQTRADSSPPSTPTFTTMSTPFEPNTSSQATKQDSGANSTAQPQSSAASPKLSPFAPPLYFQDDQHHTIYPTLTVYPTTLPPPLITHQDDLFHRFSDFFVPIGVPLLHISPITSHCDFDNNLNCPNHPRFSYQDVQLSSVSSASPLSLLYFPLISLVLSLHLLL